ncbi:unnamed protein product [Camellia sinensis]
MGTISQILANAEATKFAILDAIEVGDGHFDTVFVYDTEQPLEEAIFEALRLGLIKSRDKLFITSKLWCTFLNHDLIIPTIKMSRDGIRRRLWGPMALCFWKKYDLNLGLEYLDLYLYLIHWPLRLKQGIHKTPIPKECIFGMDVKSVWEGMEECQRLGLTKAIGVSNLSSKRLRHLLSFAQIPPAVNQVEMNPLQQQKELRDYCKSKGIHITACSPLGARGTTWGDNQITECSLLEEMLRPKAKLLPSWVAKSFNKERMRENLQIFDWSLTEEESKKISELPQREGVFLGVKKLRKMLNIT